jgi:hypothetical protein
MALCTGVAAITLTFGVVGSLPAAVRRLGTIHIPLPAKPIAVILMMTSLLAILARPRPAVGTIPPPIVRLTDAADVGSGDADPPVLSETVASAEAAPPISSVQTDSRSDIYIVQAGDSLWRIAERTLAARDSGTVTSTDIARYWPTLYEANRALIGEDPNLILPGQTFQIPEV